MISSKHYRPCVVILLFQKDGRVLIAKRIGVEERAWQLPQGGINHSESTCAAAIREMHEEIGTKNAEFLKETNDWITYDLPKHILKRNWGKFWLGQRVKVVSFLFKGRSSDINVNTEKPEFSDWRWVRLEEIPYLVIPFKRSLYERVVIEFTPTRDKIVSSP